MFKLIPLAVLLLCFTACQNQEARDIKETRFLLGTITEFTVYTQDEDLALQAIQQAVSAMQEIENKFTTKHSATNTVQQFNDSNANEKVLLDVEVEQLLLQSKLIHEETDGAFDPTLGDLNQKWGFSSEHQPVKPLDARVVKQSLEMSGIRNLHHDGNHYWLKKNDGLKLDFGGIAKGLAIDKGIEALKKYGVKHAIINAGGDMRILGDHGGTPWRVGVRHPRQTSALGWFEVSKDISIVTSGDYERFFIYQDQRFHHIINPNTGMPSDMSMSSTVSAPTAAMADALSTAMFILGYEKGMPIIENMKDVEAVWVDQTQQVHASSGMKSWLKLGVNN